MMSIDTAQIRKSLDQENPNPEVIKLLNILNEASRVEQFYRIRKSVNQHHPKKDKQLEEELYKVQKLKLESETAKILRDNIGLLLTDENPMLRKLGSEFIEFVSNTYPDTSLMDQMDLLIENLELRLYNLSKKPRTKKLRA